MWQWRGFLAVVLMSTTAALAHADVASVTTPAPPRHVNPRVKLSYRMFSIGGIDASSLWLDGAQLDVYALSRRWVRLGFELEGGAGSTDLMGTKVGLAYGLVGLTGGVQYPARVTPFVDGRAIAGVLHAQLDGSYTVGSVVLNNTSATTYLYGGGIETGAEFYAVNRLYISLALGWVHTTWRGPDTAAMIANPGAGVQTKDIAADSFTLKAGFGI